METVKVKCTPCAGNEAGEVIINKCDYDPTCHQLVDDVAQPILSSEFVPPDGPPVDLVLESSPVDPTSKPTPEPTSEPTPEPTPTPKSGRKHR